MRIGSLRQGFFGHGSLQQDSAQQGSSQQGSAQQDSIQKQLLKNSEMILERLQGKPGEVYAQHTNEFNVVYEGRDFSVSKSNSTAIYGVRSIVDGQLGFATSNSNEVSTLLEVADEAQKLARFSIPSEHHQLADPAALRRDNTGSNIGNRSKNPGEDESEGKSKNKTEMDAESESLNDLSSSDAYQWLGRVVDEAYRAKEMTLDRAEFSCTEQFFSVMNSRGVCQKAKQTQYTWFAMGMAKTAQEVTSFDYDGGCVSRALEIEEGILRTIGRFRQSVVDSLGPRPAKTYHGTVLLHPVAVMDILGPVISFNTNGKNHLDGVSAWQDQVGCVVGAKGLQVMEDPLDKNRPEGWRTFDREGVPTSPQEILREGHLNFVAHNCFSAHQAGVSPTGNALGGASALPSIGFSNIKMAPSQSQGVSEELLYKQLETGLVLKRFSGNCDPISGHFSGVAKNSWWVYDGERSHGVQEVMVSGNAFEVLKNIVAIGSTIHSQLGGSQAPYILIDGVSVTTGGV